MDARSDSSTQELARLRLKLEDDVIFAPHRYGDTTFYHVELPSRSKFFRIGLPEYTFISLLDGDTTLAEALSLTARSLGRDALNERDAAAICSWLVDTGLAHPQQSSPAARLCKADRKARGQAVAGRLNPFWMKFPLARPDGLLRRLLPLVGWIHSVPAMVVGLLLIGMGVAAVATRWDHFSGSAHAVFSPSNWLWLTAGWLLLKVLHELSHGLVCRRYGGEVRELGIVLILFAPIPYVDVTTSWRFRSKWQRIHTAAAGMYVELLVAAIAALVWSRTESAVGGHLLYSLMLMASVTTLLFNANPLMRFDGYYIATDLLEIPNLYSQGSRYVAGVARRVFLGVPGTTRLGRAWKDLLIRLYGWAAFGWRILVCVSLAIAASVLFHGAGLAIAALGIVSWLVPPAYRAVQAVNQQQRTNRWTIARAAAVSALVLAAGSSLFWLRWPGACTSPGIVEYKDSVVVRANSPGFVTAIHVENGQLVREGDLLVTLGNDELEVEYRDLQLAIEQSSARRRIHLEQQELGAAQVERENERALRKRLAERQRQIEGLTVRAPVAGRVTARGLDALERTYVKEGDEILALGDDAYKQLRISIAEEDALSYRPLVGHPVKVRLRGTAGAEGRLTRIIPRASQTPTHLALCAPFGGPLAVTKVSDPDTEDAYELTLPRFTAVVELPRAGCAEHHAGEFGYITIRPDQADSIAGEVTRRVRRWIEDKLNRAKQASAS